VTAAPLQGLSAGFAEARRRCPDQLVDQTFSVGGIAVNAHIVGRDLAHLFARSLARAGEAAQLPALTLQLWDEQATGVAPGPVTEQQDGIVKFGAAGERLGFTEDGRFLHFSTPHFDIRLDRNAEHAVGWVRSDRTLMPWHRTRPLQTLFVPWLGGRGRIVVHAAMVAHRGLGIVMAGPPHSGKSTTIAACAAAGLDVLGDETIAIEIRDDRVWGHCLHGAVKLRRQGLHRHPVPDGETETLGAPWQEEAVVAFLDSAFPGQVVASAKIVALGFPHLVPEPDTTTAVMSPGQALRKLTGSVLSVEPGRVGSMFDAAAEVAMRVATYSVAVGCSAERIAAGLTEVLEDAR